MLILDFKDVFPMLLLLALWELAAEEEELSELAAFFSAAIDAFTSRCSADKSY